MMKMIIMMMTTMMAMRRMLFVKNQVIPQSLPRAKLIKDQIQWAVKMIIQMRTLGTTVRSQELQSRLHPVEQKRK